MVRDDDGWHGWLRYELAVNHLYREMPVWAVCAYDTRTTPAEVLADVASTHGHLMGPGGSRASERYREPTELLVELSAAEIDPLEGMPPAVTLTNPTQALARGAVAALVAGALADDDAHGMVAAVSEVAANAIAHGRPPVTLRAWTAVSRAEQGPARLTSEPHRIRRSSYGSASSSSTAGSSEAVPVAYGSFMAVPCSPVPMPTSPVAGVSGSAARSLLV